MPSLVAKSTERRPAGPVRCTVTVATDCPSVALTVAEGNCTVGCASTIVTVVIACEPISGAPVPPAGCGSLSCTYSVSLPSDTASTRIGMRTVFVVSPGPNVTRTSVEV